MGTEGIMGLFPEIPIIPAFPENSPQKAKPFNKTNLPNPTTPISCEKAADTTLGKKATDG